MRSLWCLLAAAIGFGAASRAPAQAPASGEQLWKQIKSLLQAPDGAATFELLHDTQIPPTPDSWTRTVVSSEPADAPTKLVLGFGDSRTPEITLLIEEKLKPVRPGTKVVFQGAVRLFTANPYMLTFEVDPSDDVFFLIRETAAGGEVTRA
jgi:hypothetical protein